MELDRDACTDPHGVQIALARHHQAVRRACLPCWIACALPARALGVLVYLHTHDAATIGCIKDAFALTGPTASLQIDQLARQGLVTRAEDPADRRRTVVRLTPSGMALIGDLMSGSEECRSERFERLDHDELRALIAGLRALTAALGEAAGAVPGGCSTTRIPAALDAHRDAHPTVPRAPSPVRAAGYRPATRMGGRDDCLPARRSGP